MSMNQLLNQFLGSPSASPQTKQNQGSGISESLSGLAGKLPAGLAGGAAAGGLVALLVGSKKARKYAGTAATYGGAAVLGGLAFKAYQNWRQQPAAHVQPAPMEVSGNAQDFHQQALTDRQSDMPFELTLVRAMIAAAKADGHIDGAEQKRIFDAVERMELSHEHKGFIFECLGQDITVQELAAGAQSLELRSEIYLASCLVIDIDHPAERAHLDALGHALQLPGELCQELQNQAQQAVAQAA